MAGDGLYAQYGFACPGDCGRDEEMIFFGTVWDAWGECPVCGDVNISPAELWLDAEIERQQDERREER
jgi:hypothetical protein